MINLNFFKNYCDKVKPLIFNVIYSKRKPFVHSPTLFQETTPHFVKKLEDAFYVRQSHQKEGYIGQILLGNWPGWIDINEIGVEKNKKSGRRVNTKLKQPDIWKKDNSAFIELKNRYNMVKASDITKTVYEPLSQYKAENPETLVIYGIINPKPSAKNLTNIIYYNDSPITRLEGIDLFKFICHYEIYNYANDVIKFARGLIEESYSK